MNGRNLCEKNGGGLDKSELSTTVGGDVSKGMLRTAPMPLLAPVTSTVLPRSREALKTDMDWGFTRTTQEG